MNRSFRRLAVAPIALALMGASVAVAGASNSAESPKPRANAVDRAFVREMVPHHRMAVEMARMAVEKAEHQEIQSTAEDIIRTQGREIRQLRKIARRLNVKPAAMGDHEQMMEDAETLGLTMEEMGMSMDMSMLEDADPFDREFIGMMITHHQGAIRMARSERRDGRHRRLRAIAKHVIRAQSKEIRQLNRWRERWYGEESPSGGVPQD
jgi:uncharacterized protein (DUF305 family)